MMKSKLTFSLPALMLLFAALMFSCKKDLGNSLGDDGGGTGGGGGGPLNALFTAKVNGTDFIALPGETLGAYVSLGNLYNMSVIGKNASGASIHLALTGIPGPGSYEIKSDLAHGVAVFYTEEADSDQQPYYNWAAPYDDTTSFGMITITQMSMNRIKGTFHFSAKNVMNPDNEVAVTDGVVDVSFE